MVFSQAEYMRKRRQDPEFREKEREYDRKREKTQERKAYRSAKKKTPHGRRKNVEYSTKSYRKHRHYLMSKYGITLQQYDAMLEAQQFKCLICQSDSPAQKNTWHIDHCHATGKVRGILCHLCNLMLGHARDNVDTLAAGIGYLLYHQAAST